MTSIIQDAEAGGASDAQLAILRQAQIDGELPIEGARAAARAMVQCVIDAGSDAFWEDTRTQSGLLVPEYNWLSDTPEQMAIGEACDIQEATWVNQLYGTQPLSLTVNEAYLDQQAPIVRACLEMEGYATDSNGTTRELLRQALDVALNNDHQVDCLAEAKIESF